MIVIHMSATDSVQTVQSHMVPVAVTRQKVVPLVLLSKYLSSRNTFFILSMYSFFLWIDSQLLIISVSAESSWADQDIVMDCDRMRFIFQVFLMVLLCLDFTGQKSHQQLISSYEIFSPLCSYHRRKWTQQPEFKSWTKLFAFHTVLIPLKKVCFQRFSIQLWVNSRAGCTYHLGVVTDIAKVHLKKINLVLHPTCLERWINA